METCILALPKETVLNGTVESPKQKITDIYYIDQTKAWIQFSLDI